MDGRPDRQRAMLRFDGNVVCSYNIDIVGEFVPACT